MATDYDAPRKTDEELAEDSLEELKALGVDQFALYLQHDDKDHTLLEYGERIIPAIQDTVLAKS